MINILCFDLLRAGGGLILGAHQNLGLGGEGGWGSHCAGRRFRTKLMSRYIGSSPNGRFDVRFEELVSKAENPGGFLRKNVF